MPSILSSHTYTLVALAAVCTLLVATLNSYTTSLEAASEIEQLKNLLNHVAAKGNELLTIVAATNSSAQVFLQLPATIGHKQYWLHARNDSSSVWLEGSLGQMTENGQHIRFSCLKEQLHQAILLEDTDQRF
ncbi:MAG: hypothetical protein ACE5KD_04770 [Candidatus Bathyarchaeia archaeon]